jgi:hypothetical protein
MRPLYALLMKTPLEGARSTFFCALSPRAVPGRYHMDCKQQTPSHRWAYDNDQTVALWNRSVIATGLPAEFDLPSQ